MRNADHQLGSSMRRLLGRKQRPISAFHHPQSRSLAAFHAPASTADAPPPKADGSSPTNPDPEPVPDPVSVPVPAKKHRPLPLPPVLNPELAAARKRHRVPKAQPDLHQLTPLQQKLQHCPYALALATPVRNCAVTFARLPQFFLLAFEPRTDPSTNRPWMLPLDLDVPADTKPPPPPPPRSVSTTQADAGTAPPSSPSGARSRMCGAYALAQHSFIDLLSGRGATVWKRLLTERHHVKYALRLRDMRWHEHMAAAILRLLRRRALFHLAWVARRRHCVARWDPCARYGGRYGDVGCLLWMGPALRPSSVETAIAAERALSDTTSAATAAAIDRWSAAVTAPTAYATLPVKGQHQDDERPVIVYNMVRLFAPEQLAELRASLRPSLQNEVVVLLRAHPVTRAPRSWLWKLQGYLGPEDAPAVEEDPPLTEEDAPPAEEDAE
ncbi:MAG: hypothetical protein M1826_001402 [Phylliscum demangeonii]|nr:MAG: hypothetical protein M1826_001402 [Phylliscum demangeonii]